MGKSYKVWIEIEEDDGKGNYRHGGDIGILPDSVGFFEGKGAKAEALARIAEIVHQYGLDPENSDAVKAALKALKKARTCKRCGEK